MLSGNVGLSWVEDNRALGNPLGLAGMEVLLFRKRTVCVVDGMVLLNVEWCRLNAILSLYWGNVLETVFWVL